MHARPPRHVARPPAKHAEKPSGHAVGARHGSIESWQLSPLSPPTERLSRALLQTLTPARAHALACMEGMHRVRTGTKAACMNARRALSAHRHSGRMHACRACMECAPARRPPRRLPLQQDIESQALQGRGGPRGLSGRPPCTQFCGPRRRSGPPGHHGLLCARDEVSVCAYSRHCAWSRERERERESECIPVNLFRDLGDHDWQLQAHDDVRRHDSGDGSSPWASLCRTDAFLLWKHHLQDCFCTRAAQLKT
jgi:hypothetical protein